MQFPNFLDDYLWNFVKGNIVDKDIIQYCIEHHNHDPIDKYFSFRVESQVQIFVSIGFHVVALLRLTPTRISRNGKGIELMTQDKNDESACIKFSFKLMPTSLLLYKLTLRPQTISNSRKIVLMIHKFIHDLLLTIKVSSTYYVSPNWIALGIIPVKPLAVSRDKNGDMGSPDVKSYSCHNVSEVIPTYTSICFFEVNFYHHILFLFRFCKVHQFIIEQHPINHLSQRYECKLTK